MLRMAEDRDRDLRRLPEERLLPLRGAERRTKIISGARSKIDFIRGEAMRAGQATAPAAAIKRAIVEMERDWRRAVAVSE